MIHVVRLGSPRATGGGVRIGTVRFPPRGVRKQDLSLKNFYDVWLPVLAPSAALVKKARGADDERGWKAFVRGYRREMASPEASRTLDLLAALSRQSSFSVGCYCENESRCHRSILRELLVERGADVR